MSSRSHHLYAVGRGRLRLAGALLGALALVAASGLAGLAAASTGRSRASGTRARAAAASAIRFSHAVIVDEQRPGFEPDVKVAPNRTIYSSIPFGFSTTHSFVWSSRDRGNSYQLVPGNIFVGKPTTCIGGGDTDLFVDPQNALYFSDLQGLTNITDSASTNGGRTFSTTCAGVPNTVVDRMWFAGTGSRAKGNLHLYQDFDSVAQGASPNVIGNNQLVETISQGGLHFAPVINTALNTCTGISAYDCVTNNEGISGNQVVDPKTGNVYIAHTAIDNSSGTPGVAVSEGKITTAPGATFGAWAESPNLDASLCPDSSCADSQGNPEELAGENFATIARDSAGYLYVTFTAGPLDHNSSSANFGGLTAPEQVYIVHSLSPAGSNPAAVKWSAPKRITGSGASAGTNTFPWIVAGSNGRVEVAYYHTAEVSQQGPCANSSGTCTVHGANDLSHAEWSVQLAQSLGAHANHPTYKSARVSENYLKHGAICTNGLGCTGDRSLGDFLQVTIDKQGAAVVSWVFDTSADTSAGEDAGPAVVSRQVSGPSLFASVGHVSRNGGPGLFMNSVKDPTGDADYSANGMRTSATHNLDLNGASLANGKNRTLIAKIDVRILHSLTVPLSLGGTDGSWLLRWTQVRAGKPGNGDIYYAGMDNEQGLGGSGKPTFFAGNTAGLPSNNPAEHTKFITYPQTHVLSGSQASYSARTGVITIRVPRSDVGNPANGTVLYSATAFSATALGPQSSVTIFNLIDSTTPFDFVVGRPAKAASKHRHRSGAHRRRSRRPAFTG